MKKKLFLMIIGLVLLVSIGIGIKNVQAASNPIAAKKAEVTSTVNSAQTNLKNVISKAKEIGNSTTTEEDKNEVSKLISELAKYQGQIYDLSNAIKQARTLEEIAKIEDTCKSVMNSVNQVTASLSQIAIRNAAGAGIGAGAGAGSEVGGTVGFDPGNGEADCVGLAGFVYYGVYVIKVIQIIVPIILIIWGSIDLIKSIISGDEKKISAARKPFIQRLISALIVFLLPWIVNFAIGFASSDGNAAWKDCWKKAWNGGKKADITSDDLDLWSPPTQ